MKTNLLIALYSTAAITTVCVAEAQNPKAPQEAIVVSGNARFTILTPEMIRIEYSDNAIFEDRATFAIQNRELESIPQFSTSEDSNYLYISTPKLNLKYRKGTNPKQKSGGHENLTISLSLNGQVVNWHPGMSDPLNLKGTCRTLDNCNGDSKRKELENGLLSRSGWAVIDDSWSATRPDGSKSFALVPNDEVGFDWWAERNDSNSVDLYFMGYGLDYKKAIYDFTQIAGKVPLPPDYVFGYWYSRYESYSDNDYRQIMNDLESNDIPTDVMILDMDWHWNGDPNSQSANIGAWTGWSWNTNLIPQPKQLLNDIHDKNFKIALNLHPADGINATESPNYFSQMTNDLNGRYSDGKTIGWNLDFTDFTKSFFKHIIRDHEEEGVDFWWLDWQQHLTSYTTQHLGETFWCNHVFFNDMKVNRPDRRPVIFHRWGGLGCHRYQIGFSGDTYINYPTLAFLPYFTSTASNVCYAFWGHDLGGHQISDKELANDPELIQKWAQFAIFTPIFRSHACKDGRIERRIWKLPNFPKLRDAVKLRYALFPYIYTMARQTYDTGLGMCRPLYYEYPENEEAYLYENEYFFGDNILVAPITEASKDGLATDKKIWFPNGGWWCVSTGEMINGQCVKNMSFKIDEIPYFYRAGAVIPLNPSSVKKVTERPTELILDVVAGAAGTGTLYEDRGDNVDYNDSFATTSFKHLSSATSEIIVIEPRNGDTTGLVSKRSWCINLLNIIDSPSNVKVNDKKVKSDAWSFDTAKKTVTINIPLTKCSKAIKVEVIK